MKYNLKTYEDFYQSDLPGPHGLTFDQSLEFAKLDAEKRHDYFQWLFPTDVESSFNKAAPFLDEELKSTIPKEKILAAVELYWLYLNKIEDWPNPTDHNNLRLSRMLRSLNLLDLSDEAGELYKELIDIHFMNKNLTLNNLDHFRAAMFQKTFFVEGEIEDIGKVRIVLKELLPDHQLEQIQKADADFYLKLHEPVLHLDRDGEEILCLENLKSRGKISRLKVSNTHDLERFFFHYRFWY